MTYQLTFYKKFFCEITEEDPKNVETHFCLMKRTVKKNRIEFFRVSSGNKKIQNATKTLNESIKNILKGNFFKNKTNCLRCSFNRTEHCSGLNNLWKIQRKKKVWER